ncbi:MULTISPECIES: hypothetical protein [unclassified Geodermatophilus]
MSFAHEYLARSRAQELIGDADRARRTRCLRPSRPWRRRPRRCCP